MRCDGLDNRCVSSVSTLMRLLHRLRHFLLVPQSSHLLCPYSIATPRIPSSVELEVQDVILDYCRLPRLSRAALLPISASLPAWTSSSPSLDDQERPQKARVCFLIYSLPFPRMRVAAVCGNLEVCAWRVHYIYGVCVHSPEKRRRESV